MSLPFSKGRSKVRITPVIRLVSRRLQPELPIAEPSVPESIQIQNPPVPEPVQIHFPELDTLESTLTDASSLDQLMSLVFGEEPASPVHTQETQLLHTLQSIFDGNNFFISFLDEFERELGIEPLDLRMPRLNHCVKQSIGFKAIKPMDLDLSVNKWGFGTKLVGPLSLLHHYRIWKSGSVAGSTHVLRDRKYPYTILFEPNFVVLVPRSFGKTVIVFTSHLDLTWENGVDLKFFRVGRSLSHPVPEAYQPKNTNAYLHFGSHVLHATGGRVHDVVGRWEMHQDENLPWGMVCL
ncbi:hypothetical protein TNCV_1337261 [Trichonephila clavipes]|nr:hypothetical protein TNCV_1337261 [Trichonephila clavipes]